MFEDKDTIFLYERVSELPEVVVESNRQRMLHILAYVREYSTEIAELKKKLTEAEIRAEVYLETIRVAESTLGISITKKSGAK